MKTIKNKILKVIITLMVTLWVPLAASAADMWAETPDLNGDAESPSFIAEPHTFKYESPLVDMWAKTPNLLAEREEHGVYIDTESRFVIDFNPEMYVETPEVNATSSAPRVKRVKSILVADEK